jgi:DNA-binding NtrC family response regulator
MTSVPTTHERSTAVVLVVGLASPRTRTVLRALRDKPLVWPFDGASALAHVAGDKVGCLIITDYVTGQCPLDFLTRVRELARDLAIVVTIDPGQTDQAVAAMRHGASTVIEIPSCIELLRRFVVETAH